MIRRTRASIILIGNELLSGRVRDENLPFLAGALWSLGVRIERATMIRDEVPAIAGAVREAAAGSDFVLTTGGIGPTHDDVTIAGVAEAFGVGVVQHDDLAERIRTHLGREPSEAELRMADVPEGAELVGGTTTWPTIRMRNVYVLPGIPSILRRKFDELRGEFRGSPFHRTSRAFRTTETVLAPRLHRLVEAFPDLEIGSYPEPDRVLVTIEGQDAQAVANAGEQLDMLTADIPRA